MPTIPDTDSAVSSLSKQALENEVVSLAGHLAAAHCRWLDLLAEFDNRDGWSGPGMRSCAHWLSWRVGMSLRTAQEQLRVAHTLTDLPAVHAAFAAGRVSYSKIRAITRIATPDNEQVLLKLALGGTVGQLERVVRLTRQSQATPTCPDRSLRWSYDDDGFLRLSGKLPAEQGAHLVAALSSLTAPGHGPDSGDSLAARRADALTALISNPDRCPTTKIVVQMSADITDDPLAEPATIAGGPALPEAAAQRHLCAVKARALITDRARNPLYLGRSRRLVSKTMLATLRHRDRRQCRYPGCANVRWLEVHQIQQRHKSGPADLHNLVLLCQRHHTLIHTRGYGITGSGTALRFTAPDGTVIPEAGAPGHGATTELANANPPIPADPLTPAGTGERLDPTPILIRLLTPRVSSAA